MNEKKGKIYMNISKHIMNRSFVSQLYFLTISSTKVNILCLVWLNQWNKELDHYLASTQAFSIILFLFFHSETQKSSTNFSLEQYLRLNQQTIEMKVK